MSTILLIGYCLVALLLLTNAAMLLVCDPPTYQEKNIHLKTAAALVLLLAINVVANLPVPLPVLGLALLSLAISLSHRERIRAGNPPKPQGHPST